MRFASLTLCLGALIVSPALAQQRPAATGGSVVPMLGQNKQLHEELKMGADQVEKVAAALNKINEELKDDIAKARDRATPQPERTEINRKVSEARTKALDGLLKPEQMKRVKEIDLQRAGAGAFGRKEVQESLSLTDEQKTKVKDLTDTMQKGVREANQGGANTPEAQTKVQELRKETLEGVHKVLTDEQKKDFKKLLGEPFELKPTRPNN